MKSILIVDDSKTTRQILHFSLSDAGFRVTEAVDGLDALNFIERDRYDLLITDLNMPRMGGIELARNTRKAEGYKYTPIIILTSESDDEMKMAGKRAGASCWIVKPFEHEQLIKVINMSLGPD
ncbi:MAG: hypothetical protein C0615_05680 [Desulfuromonas sp.]|nr:MAG: hypothetical protein C0615_05680 [Desulfuromonas sp.]